MHKTEAGSETLTMFRACLIWWRACCYALAQPCYLPNTFCALPFFFSMCNPLVGCFSSLPSKL